MKDVCQQTGLTDRSVRYYIECGLLVPNSQDNYAGRKNYTFTREDVERLGKIKILRGAGFSVEQIKALFLSRSTKDTVAERLQELETEREKSDRLLDLLQKADIDREVSLEELTIILSSDPTPIVEPEAPPETRSRFPYWIFWVAVILVVTVLRELETTRFSWILQRTQYIWLNSAGLLGVIAWFHRSYWKRYMAVIALLLTIPFVGFSCGYINRPAMMDEAIMAKLDAIPWNDREYLLQHGFDEYEEDSESVFYLAQPLEYWDLEKDRAVYSTLYIQVHNLKKDKGRDMTYGGTSLDELIWVSYDNEISRWFRRPSSVEREYWISSKDRYIVLSLEDETAPLDFALLDEFFEQVLPDTIAIPDDVSFGMSPRQLKAVKGQPVEVSGSTVSPHLWYDYAEHVGGYKATVRYTFLKTLFSKSLSGVSFTVTVDDAAQAKEWFDELYQLLTQYYETHPYYYNNGVVTESERHYRASLGTDEGATGIAVDLAYEYGVLSLNASRIS